LYISYEGYSGWLYRSYQYHPEYYPWSHFNGYNDFDCIDRKHCKYKYGSQASGDFCSECEKSRTLYEKNVTKGIDDDELKTFVNDHMYRHYMICDECNKELHDSYYNCDNCIGDEYIRYKDYNDEDDPCKDTDLGNMRSEYDLCKDCYDKSVHPKEHTFTELKVVNPH